MFGCHISFSAIKKKLYAAPQAQIYAISGHEESVKEIGFTSIIRGEKGGVIRIHNGRQP